MNKFIELYIKYNIIFNSIKYRGFFGRGFNFAPLPHRVIGIRQKGAGEQQEQKNVFNHEWRH